MNRVISGSVSEIARPSRICSAKIWMTEPLEPATLPKRVEAKIVSPPPSALAAVISRSPINFDVPMTFVGLTALSELVNNTRATLASLAAVTTFCTPLMFVSTAARGCISQSATCL